MASACSAIYFLNMKGDILIQRTYRDDVEYASSDIRVNCFSIYLFSQNTCLIPHVVYSFLSELLWMVLYPSENKGRRSSSGLGAYTTSVKRDHPEAQGQGQPWRVA